MDDLTHVVNLLESQICPALDEILETYSTALTKEQLVTMERTLSALETVLYALTSD